MREFQGKDGKQKVPDEAWIRDNPNLSNLYHYRNKDYLSHDKCLSIMHGALMYEGALYHDAQEQIDIVTATQF